MKKRFKEQKMLIILLVVIAVAVFGILRLTGGFTVRSGVRIGYVGKESRSRWSGRYVSFDGMMKKTIYPEGDTLHVEIKTESGTISIEMKDSHGKVIFEKKNIETSSFDVEVPEKVVIRIEADHHKGSFDIGG